MATRANRAATAANKKGGKSNKRNRSVELINRHRSLDSEENREAFLRNRHETLARRRNISMNSETSTAATGVREGSDFTLRHEDRTRPELKTKSANFHLWSHVFKPHKGFPRIYTQDGKDLSPPLYWHGAAPTAEEFALLCEDITVPEDEPPLVHWLIYRIPGHIQNLPEGLAASEEVPNVLGALQGLNDFGRIGYTGPNPPYYDGWHHYRFRLFALDRNVRRLRPGLSREELFERIQGHVLNETELLTRYRRTRWTLLGLP
jgi:Raf kinase inhibitor-like YbhB/YbcL family protein